MSIRIKIRNMGIFKKITLLTVTVILLFSAISTAFLLKQLSDNLKEKDRLLVLETAQKIYTFTRDKYNITYNQQTLVHSSNYISSIISTTRTHPSDIYQEENLSKIMDYLAALDYSDDSIQDVILFTRDGANAFSHSNSSGRKVYLGYDYNSLPYIEEFDSSEKNIIMICDEAPPYLTLSSSSQLRETISYIAKIYDTSYPTRRAITGYLMINFSLGSFSGTYSEIELASDGIYYVSNADGQIVYTNDRALLNSDFSAIPLKEEDILLNKTVGVSGIHVAGTLRYDALQARINTIIVQMLLITAGCILCMVLIITILYQYYGHKFQQLTRAMHDISQGDFNVRLPTGSQDEIGYLSDAFNTMSDTLNTYINKTYLAQTQQRTAELYALKSQINPHFLANTIESIRMKALSDGSYEVSEMLVNLGSLFSWMISFKQDIVYLEDELDYIKSYLDLQRFRFEEQLAVEFDVPSEVYYMGIPKFTLQPIVENAITHGFRNSTHTLTISITISQENSRLIIRVSDDGLGMQEDLAKKLQEHINGGSQDAQFGIALRNIHTRIRLLFGDSCGLGIKSTLYRGTCVTVTIPASEKKEMEKYVQDYNRR